MCDVACSEQSIWDMTTPEWQNPKKLINISLLLLEYCSDIVASSTKYAVANCEIAVVSNFVCIKLTFYPLISLFTSL